MAKCTHYETCQREALNGHDGRCILHSKNSNKDTEAFDKALSEHHKENGPKFTRMIFPAGIGFDGQVFEMEVDFAGAIFEGEARFEGATFQEGAVFWDAVFKDDFLSNEAKYNGYSHFNLSQFEGKSNLKNTTFRGGVDFSLAEFRNGINLNDAQIKGDASFFGATFGSTAVFWGATFVGKSIFKCATFEQQSYFSGGVFEGKADFSDGTVFEKTAYFGTVKFRDDVLFNTVNFKGNVRFTKSCFLREVNFERAIFRGSVDFRYTVFGQRACFNRSTFSNQARFFGESENRRLFIDTRVDFRNITYTTENPVRFRYADLSQCRFLRTDLRGIDFTGVKWPSGVSSDGPVFAEWFQRAGLYDEIYEQGKAMSEKKSGPKSASKSPPWSEIERLYRQLKQNYEKRGDFPRAGDFHIGEKVAQRQNSETHWGKISLLTMYRVLSKYGERALPAVLWLVVLILSCCTGYVLMGSSPSGTEEILSISQFSDWGKAFILSIETTFFPVQSAGFDQFGPRLLNVFQRIASPVLLALLALAIRQRVKR